MSRQDACFPLLPRPLVLPLITARAVSSFGASRPFRRNRREGYHDPRSSVTTPPQMETVSARQHDYAPLLRFLPLATTGSGEVRWFPWRSPVKGKSNGR